ncbi:hypothetical protein VP01_917g4 [Puccinia sorghi]|uniref:Uncharacterized protein n=1 Tax=Puccinia sorghi TaxID=27349 RepID=A0A0L6U7E2_9BASI|nr:hypothetical protein VP01_917g4 [Puccinia sorghi]
MAWPPPLPPRPLPSSQTPNIPATRPSARDSVGEITSPLNKPPDVNLSFEVEGSSYSTLATNPSPDTTHTLPPIAHVSSRDDALTLDTISEAVIPSSHPSPGEDSAPPIGNQDKKGVASQSLHLRGDSTSELSFCLDPIPQDGPQESDSYDEKLAEIERLEVSGFLKRSSKYLNQVTFQTVESESVSAPVPTLSDFRSTAGQIDWVGFCDAYVAAQLERYCPNALRSSSTQAPVSMSQLKAQASRSYVAILPELWSIISGNQLSNVYRWENPRRTAFYLFTYYLLWAMDMIPSFIVAYGLYLLINRQLNPPTISQLRQEVNQRHQLGQQAQTMESQGFLDMKGGSVTTGVLGNSMFLASVALGSNLPDKGKLANTHGSSSPHTLPKKSDYRGLYSFSRSLYSDHGPEIQIMLADLADIGEKIRNLYLWRRPRACWRTSFMLVGILLYTMAISQKWLVKNFLGWLGIEFFFLLGFTDKHPQFRKILNPIWLILYDIPTDSEFALEVLQERGKKTNQTLLHNWRFFKRHHPHPSNFVNKKRRSVLSGTDRAKQDWTDGSPVNPLPKQGDITSSHRSVPSPPRSILDVNTWKRWSHKVEHGGSEILNLARNIYAGEANSHSENKTNDLLDNNIKTFAILNGKVPGNLVVQKDWIRFQPLRGFRTKSSQMQSALMKSESTCPIPRTRTLSTKSSCSSLSSITKSTAKRNASGEEISCADVIEGALQHAEDSPDLSGSGSSGTTTPTNIDLIIHFNQIIKIKKVKRSILLGLGFRISDGMEFYLDNSAVLSFDHILNRDQYFNQLLSLCSRPSQALP